MYQIFNKGVQNLKSLNPFSMNSSNLNQCKPEKPANQKNEKNEIQKHQDQKKGVIEVEKQFEEFQIEQNLQQTPQTQKICSIDYSNRYHLRGLKGHQVQRSGLPNLGNTCFLNSIIQSMFSMVQFRNRIIKYNNKENLFVYRLGKIFYQMENFHCYEIQDKKAALTQFISELKNRHMNYQGSSQEDFLDFLMLILNNLQQQSPHLTELFNIVMTQQCQNQSCQNYKKRQKFKSMYIKHVDEKCPSCLKKLKKRMICHPKYLIVLGGDKGSQIQFQNFQEEVLNYKVSAKILYSGSGSCGHYVSERKILSKNTGSQPKLDMSKKNKYTSDWRIFNDRSIQASGNHYFEVKCSFYEFVQNSTPKNQNFMYAKSEIKTSFNNQVVDKKYKKNGLNQKSSQNQIKCGREYKIIDKTFKKDYICFKKQYSGQWYIFTISSNNMFSSNFIEIKFQQIPLKLQETIDEKCFWASSKRKNEQKK